MRVGVIGLGGIGIRIAEILRGGFGCPVVYYSRTRKPQDEKRLGISYVPLDQLCSEVDALIVMIPGNDETKGLIGKNQMERFKADLVLINAAVPAVVDANSLLIALKSGKVAYAAFDRFYEEPAAIVSELKHFVPERLMVTGHIASLTHDARDAMAKKAIRSLLNILKSGSDENRVA